MKIAFSWQYNSNASWVNQFHASCFRIQPAVDRLWFVHSSSGCRSSSTFCTHAPCCVWCGFVCVVCLVVGTGWRRVPWHKHTYKGAVVKHHCALRHNVRFVHRLHFMESTSSCIHHTHINNMHLLITTCSRSSWADMCVCHSIHWNIIFDIHTNPSIRKPPQFTCDLCSHKAPTHTTWSHRW